VRNPKNIECDRTAIDPRAAAGKVAGPPDLQSAGARIWKISFFLRYLVPAGIGWYARYARRLIASTDRSEISAGTVVPTEPRSFAESSGWLLPVAIPPGNSFLRPRQKNFIKDRSRWLHRRRGVGVLSKCPVRHFNGASFERLIARTGPRNVRSPYWHPGEISDSFMETPTWTINRITHLTHHENF
jgi:hypothetical protein